MKVEGRCLCGYLVYEAEVDADDVAICHCTDCQTLSGSAFRVTVPVTGGLTFLSGAPKTFMKTAESGNKRIQAFCPECGTSIYSKPADEDSAYFGLRVGPLRQRDLLVPRSQYWRRSAQKWLDRLGSIEAHDKD